MKPFNLEKALVGYPVVTRDGRAVSNLSRKDVSYATSYPLQGYIEGNHETFTLDGIFNKYHLSKEDLFMADSQDIPDETSSNNIELLKIYKDLYVAAQNDVDAMFFFDMIKTLSK